MGCDWRIPDRAEPPETFHEEGLLQVHSRTSSSKTKLEGLSVQDSDLHPRPGPFKGSSGLRVRFHQVQKHSTRVPQSQRPPNKKKLASARECVKSGRERREIHLGANKLQTPNSQTIRKASAKPRNRNQTRSSETKYGLNSVLIAKLPNQTLMVTLSHP